MPAAARASGEMRRTALDDRLDDINRFEAMLVNEGALVLKFWFHQFALIWQIALTCQKLHIKRVQFR